MRRILILFSLFALCALHLQAQDTNGWKLSPSIRRMQRSAQAHDRQHPHKAPRLAQPLTALVRCTDPDVLADTGCRILHAWEDVYAVSLPMGRISALARHPEVKRIEAGAPLNLCNDTTATLLGVRDVWRNSSQGTGLTGKGVVVGIQDVGFDLTHPTFYDTQTGEYRIKALWDMLDVDTVGSPFVVGRDYVGQEALLQKAHSRDGLQIPHGTHTAGTAAGSGYDSPYSGMAPQAELCLVSNAVRSDLNLIAPEDQPKYTTATDLLGFQYILDYAARQGKPCVISFSEGAHEDLYGDSQLAYEVLEKMTGPGRIIVSSAGNSSVSDTYLLKPLGMDSITNFIYSSSSRALFTLRHKRPTTFQLEFCTEKSLATPYYIHNARTEDICACPDSLLVDTLHLANEDFSLMMATYPSCYGTGEWVTELYLASLTHQTVGLKGQNRIRLVLSGSDDEVEGFASGGLFLNLRNMPEYCNAVPTHNINFPASAPSVIAVGGTAYRTGVVNFEGTWKSYDMGDDGRLWPYSSVGPTLMGLIKPDVVAPACNVISSYSSYYLESMPEANDNNWNVQLFDYQGRRYPWNSNSGTSMSSPAVAGIIALWLQLCPTLTPDQVRETFEYTCRRYDRQLSYPNNLYGWGEIDALAGTDYIRTHFAQTPLERIEPDKPVTPTLLVDLLGRKVYGTARGPLKKHGISLTGSPR